MFNAGVLPLLLVKRYRRLLRQQIFKYAVTGPLQTIGAGARIASLYFWNVIKPYRYSCLVVVASC